MMERISTVTVLILTLIAATSYLSNVVSARRCESQDGLSSVECDDSDACCEDNYGDVECCNAVRPWWTWVIFVAFIIGAIICCICCCYCIKKYAHASFGSFRTTVTVPVQTVRTYNVTTASQLTTANQPNHTVVKMVPFNQPSSSGFTSNTSVLPPYSLPSNTNAPPPYCEAKH